MAMPVQLGSRAPEPARPAWELVATLEAALRIARDLLAAAEATSEARAGAPVRLGRGAVEPCADWPPVAPPTVPEDQPLVGHGRLTAREVEVLRLIAAGQSNREMAEALCRSERTVERHIENIYHKIGAHSKADATAFAFRHRLA